MLIYLRIFSLFYTMRAQPFWIPCQQWHNLWWVGWYLQLWQNILNEVSVPFKKVWLRAHTLRLYVIYWRKGREPVTTNKRAGFGLMGQRLYQDSTWGLFSEWHRQTSRLLGLWRGSSYKVLWYSIALRDFIFAARSHIVPTSLCYLHRNRNMMLRDKSGCAYSHAKILQNPYTKYEYPKGPLSGCDVRVRALMLLNSEPLQDPRMRTDPQRTSAYIHRDNSPG